MEGEVRPPPPHKGGPDFCPGPMTDLCGTHLNTTSILFALDSVAFMGLFLLPSHIISAQRPPPLGSFPWLNPSLSE